MNGQAQLIEATAAGTWTVIPYAILCGVMLGILYDGFRLFRIATGLRTARVLQRFRLPYIALCVLDMLFCVCAGAVFSVFLYHRDGGMLRWYTVLSAIGGFAAYMMTVGHPVMRVAARMAETCKHVVSHIRNRLPQRKEKQKKKERPHGKKTKRTAKKA